MKSFRIFLSLFLLLAGQLSIANYQLSIGTISAQGVTLSGSVQSDMLVPRHDPATGAKKTGDFLTNTYAELMLQSKYVDAGARLEFLEYPLPGYEKDFEGWGVPNF